MKQTIRIGVILFLLIQIIGVAASDEMSCDRGDSTLKVVSYNLWHGLNPKGIWRFMEYETPDERELRLEGFLAQVRGLNPDVIFLQEVNPAPKMAKRIAKELDYDAIFLIDNAGLKFGSVGLPVNLRSGLAILAHKRFGLKKLGGKKLSGPTGSCSRSFSFQLKEFRYALAGRITLKGSPVLLVNTHLHHGLEPSQVFLDAIDNLVKSGTITQEEADNAIASNKARQRRTDELQAAHDFIFQLGMSDVPTIFAGDFNATPKAPELDRLLFSMGYRSVIPTNEEVYTWDPKRNPNTLRFGNFETTNDFEALLMKHEKQMVISERRKLDYIFYKDNQKRWQVNNSGLFGDTLYRGRMSSDHFGVWADLTFQ